MSREPGPWSPRWSVGAAWFLTACLGACTTPLPEGGSGAGWSSGRISVSVEATPTQAAQGMSAAFDLQGNGARGELRLHSPLGTRMATARWSAGVAVLVLADGEHSFTGLDELARHALGEALPLAALPDWLAGRPWADAPYEGTSEGFEQLGWRVALTQLAQGRITATRSSPPAVRVRIQLDSPPA